MHPAQLAYFGLTPSVPVYDSAGNIVGAAPMQSSSYDPGQIADALSKLYTTWSDAEVKMMTAKLAAKQGKGVDLSAYLTGQAGLPKPATNWTPFVAGGAALLVGGGLLYMLLRKRR